MHDHGVEGNQFLFECLGDVAHGLDRLADTI